MSYAPRTFAGIEVTPLRDAVGPMGQSIRRPLPELFTGASPDDWAGTPAEWVLHFRCYLLRDAFGRVVLVDTGIGGTDSPASSWAPVPGGLAGELAAAGVAPGDVGTVVLTHLHSDHASGAVTEGVPAFPNARHVIQRAEVDWIEGAGPNPILERVLRPLTGLIDAVDGAAVVVPGVRVAHTPGHTPGHQVVQVGSLTLTGDVVLHPVQLANPAVRYAYDEDAERAAASRQDLLRRVRAEGGLLGTGHFPEPFTDLT
ncbi:MBL fold metallo-hydrolase [Sphaerisporangium siamense]|uniref:Glyoxylase-like metal-dependent hydrolase (Beta-lactamase superfamily II) n=1 Tax=Sphaerisporangium siamense TaxID=795645 RepID=A0A7W7D374_9ACTN|nr:MBL fold metallo-hydrolase [Sphaerisporangium siamense]MBB4699154.1 glyoxylase-like metal-dependent hydrolase (beta-lactamase superfamily II) [Sphaerisporangium siamense]GII86719.1 MBL fold metallo-hydrolase [Sphaerisporangium siamense]